MKQTITKSDKNLRILNQLISSGFYNGYVGPEKFELLPNRFPNNHRLVGSINENGNYDLRFDFKPPMRLASRLLVVVIILIIVISLVNGNWILPLALGSLGILFFIDFKFKERKEINRLTDKILEFHKRGPE